MKINAIERHQTGSGQRMLAFFGLLAATAGITLAAGMAAAADGRLADAQTRYRQDRAACVSGQSQQDRATCLREAGAALQAAKRGGGGDNMDANDRDAYERNRLLRCDRLTGGDRDDCRRRMNGEGTVRGSVEAGGTFRELRTVVPAK